MNHPYIILGVAAWLAAVVGILLFLSVAREPEVMGWSLPPGVRQSDLDDDEPDNEWERECERADSDEDGDR